MIFLVLYILILGLVSAKCDVTPKPIIGILTQESYTIDKLYPNETGTFNSFIAASYVKFVESGGGRVIPISIGRDKEYYEQIVEHTNGVVFPGGAVWFNQSDGYADAGLMLYEAALNANQNGDYYPVLGICLGMELLLHVALGAKEDIRAHCDAKKISLPLEFSEGYEKSKLFSNTPKHIMDIMKNENVTANYHQFCITEANMTKHNLLDDWKILTTNRDKKGAEFVSTFEHKQYPFYGVQFHPEKNPFEFTTKINVYADHSFDAILTSQYFGNFFVQETRKNSHSFKNRDQEMDHLIYNYAPRYTGKIGGYYEQAYVFLTKNMPVFENCDNCV